jgi:hypothetical protein
MNVQSKEGDVFSQAYYSYEHQTAYKDPVTSITAPAGWKNTDLKLKINKFDVDPV